MEPYDAGTMRGIDRKQGSMLMLLSPESRVTGDASAASDQEVGRRGAGGAQPDFRRNVQWRGETVDPAGAIAQGDAADRVLQLEERAAVLRAARLQSSVSLVSGYGHGRGGLRRDGLYEEP